MRDFLTHLARDHGWQAAALTLAIGIGMLLGSIGRRT
jgi:hypothetical protein